VRPRSTGVPALVQLSFCRDARMPCGQHAPAVRPGQMAGCHPRIACGTAASFVKAALGVSRSLREVVAGGRFVNFRLSLAA
jgi:hypothetical protein